MRQISGVPTRLVHKEMSTAGACALVNRHLERPPSHRLEHPVGIRDGTVERAYDVAPRHGVDVGDVDRIIRGVWL